MTTPPCSGALVLGHLERHRAHGDPSMCVGDLFPGRKSDPLQRPTPASWNVPFESKNVPGVTVLPMVPKDLDSLYEMYAEVIDDGGGTPAEPGVPTPEAFDEGWIRNRAVFVAWSGSQRVGSYFVRSNFPAFAAHIAQSGYIVAREARGRGIGSLLLADSLKVAKDLGYRAMMFNLVFESNPSRRLYEAAGFEVVGRVPEARGEEPALIYWRRL